MRFRTTFVVAMLGLLFGVLAATFAGVVGVIDRAAARAVEQDLARGADVVAEVWASRGALFRAEARVVAEEPRLKAVVSTEDATPETVAGVAREMQRVLQSDLFFLTDAAGVVRVDVADPRGAGRDASRDALVAGALAKGAASGYARVGRDAYHVEAQRIALGATPVGVAVVGHRVDDRLAETLERETGALAILELAGDVVGVSPAAAQAADRGALAAAIRAVPEGASTVVAIGGETFRALSVSPSAGEGRGLRCVLLRSLDDALAPGRRLVRVLLAVLAAATVVALGVAAILARRISDPLDRLVAFAGKLGAGRMGARADERGPVEIRALGRALNGMAAEIEASRAEQEEKQRLARELEIAARIQTALLPRDRAVPGWQIAARMLTATEVGGDYYDVLPLPAGGCYVGVGDVAGHGLIAGLVMLMVQAGVAALVDAEDATPRDVVIRVNRLIYENVQRRLEQDEHVTLSIFRLSPAGRVDFSGAHEPVIVWRRASGASELVATPGTWTGAMPDVSRATVLSTLDLAPDDLLVLHTDGVAEARSATGEMFGVERIADVVTARASDPVAAIRDAILDAALAWSPERADDATVLVIRFVGRGDDA